MANVIKGNTATGYNTQPLQSESNLRTLIITNKTGGTVTLNLAIQNGTNLIAIAPLNLQLAAGTSYGDNNILMQPQEFIVMTVNGSVDYYFDFKPSTN